MKNLIHVMLDTETLATDIPAVTTSFAAVEFDPWGDPEDTLNTEPKYKLVKYLNIDEQLAHGFKFNTATLHWWVKNPRMIPDCLPENYLDIVSVSAFLNNLNGWLLNLRYSLDKPHADFALWVRGPEFDLATLRCMYQTCGISPEYKYDTAYNLRDWLRIAFGTSKPYQLLDMTKELLPAHGALNDCRAQIFQVQHAVKKLGLK